MTISFRLIGTQASQIATSENELQQSEFILNSRDLLVDVVDCNAMSYC
ncbi:hypothetical protein VHP8226_02141 [Vibrio hippocampi]|uniref:Uncharacterized protein n=1 Tax=Vibrio hippocampi TaxID=654686 RepID=A0ABM8ZIX3_9VIBR|nr:hypothetical protein VHP8226_02141 [Vibrio hippocampi]